VSGRRVVGTLPITSILKSAVLEELFPRVVLGRIVVGLLHTTRRHSCVALVELFPKKEVDPLVVDILLITLILKSAAPAKLWLRAVLDLPAVGLLPTIRRPRCVVRVELSQEKEFCPDVAGTQLIMLILRSAVRAKLWPRVVSDLAAVDLCPTMHRLKCAVPVE